MMVVDDRFKLFLDDDDANSESDDEEQGLEDDDDTSSDNDEGSRYRSLLRNVDLDDQDDFIDDDDMVNFSVRHSVLTTPSLQCL